MQWFLSCHVVQLRNVIVRPQAVAIHGGHGTGTWIAALAVIAGSEERRGNRNDERDS